MRLKDIIFNIDTLNAFESSQLLSRMNWSIKNCWYLNSIDILLNSSSNLSTKLPNIMNLSQIYGWVWIKNPTQQTHVERPFLMAFLVFPSQNVILVFRTKPRPVNVSFKVSGSGGTSWHVACFFSETFSQWVGDLDDGKFCPQTNWMDGFVMIHVWWMIFSGSHHSHTI